MWYCLSAFSDARIRAVVKYRLLECSVKVFYAGCDGLCLKRTVLRFRLLIGITLLLCGIYLRGFWGVSTRQPRNGEKFRRLFHDLSWFSYPIFLGGSCKVFATVGDHCLCAELGFSATRSLFCLTLREISAAFHSAGRCRIDHVRECHLSLACLSVLGESHVLSSIMVCWRLYLPENPNPCLVSVRVRLSVCKGSRLVMSITTGLFCGHAFLSGERPERSVCGSLLMASGLWFQICEGLSMLSLPAFVTAEEIRSRWMASTKRKNTARRERISWPIICIARIFLITVRNRPYRIGFFSHRSTEKDQLTNHLHCFDFSLMRVPIGWFGCRKSCCFLLGVRCDVFYYCFYLFWGELAWCSRKHYEHPVKQPLGIDSECL